MTTTARGLAETFVTMLNEHDPNLVDRFVGRDYINHNAFVGDGREANRQLLGRVLRRPAQPDRDDGGSRDLRRPGGRPFTYRGTHTGEFLGIAATGRHVEMRSMDIWRVQDGMFAEHWDELNTLELLQQMGAL